MLELTKEKKPWRKKQLVSGRCGDLGEKGFGLHLDGGRGDREK